MGCGGKLAAQIGLSMVVRGGGAVSRLPFPSSRRFPFRSTSRAGEFYFRETQIRLQSQLLYLFIVSFSSA